MQKIGEKGHTTVATAAAATAAGAVTGNVAGLATLVAGTTTATAAATVAAGTMMCEIIDMSQTNLSRQNSTGSEEVRTCLKELVGWFSVHTVSFGLS